MTPLSPTERQTLLRRLKHSPALPKADLAQFATKLKQEIVEKRTPK